MQQRVKEVMGASVALDCDAELMLRVKDGDGASFGLLLGKYRASVTHFLYRMVQDQAISEELAQEVFLRVYRSRETYEPTAKFTTWLYRIATNQVRMHFRKKRWLFSLDQLMEETAFEPIDPVTMEGEKLAAERILREQEDFLTIQSRVAELPIKYQEVIALRYFEEKSVKEIAEILNKKEGTVKSLLSRGITRLKHLL
jgi:RNA polymerase sigma-70 factor (ECF subfamily)